jgi:hypothetical protein
MENLTKDQLHTLRHMLGINTPDDRIPKPYRNYAAVNPGDPDFLELEKLGVIKKCASAKPGVTEYDYYRCTDEGRLAAMRSHRDIRKPKSSRRYSMYLDISDLYPDLTFKEFLTDPYFKDLRNNC